MDRVGDGGGHADLADLADALHTWRVDDLVFDLGPGETPSPPGNHGLQW
jgi:hypothetical protein